MKRGLHGSHLLMALVQSFSASLTTTLLAKPAEREAGEWI